MRLNTWRYRLTRDPQDALRQRLRELAAVRVRFGYRRLMVLLRREGWRVNAKRVYRLYGQEGLEVRTKPRPLVSDLDGARPFHARITGTRRRSFAHWCEGRGGLSDVLRHRPAPQAITVDNGSSADQLTGPQQRAHPDGLISRVRTRSSVSVP